MPGAALGVPAGKGLCVSGGGAGLGAGCRERRGAAERREAVVRLGLRRRRWRRQTDRSWCAPRGGLDCAPPSRGLELRGVALPSWDSGRRWPQRRPGWFPTQGSEGRDPPLPGRRETAPEARARVYPGCRAATALGWA